MGLDRFVVSHSIQLSYGRVISSKYLSPAMLRVAGLIRTYNLRFL